LVKPMKNNSIIIAPSILSADFARLGSEIKLVEEGGADWIHLDVMDGRFVPNLTFGPIIVDAVNRLTELPLDVHLMVEEPERYFEEFYKSGSDWITIHFEASQNIRRTLEQIHQFGIKSGISIKPGTSVNEIKPFLDAVDLVLIMSVEPGFGGQKFIASSIDKIHQLMKIRAENHYDYLISIDGGIKESNASEITAAGVDILVAGSFIYHSADPPEALRSLRKAVMSL